MNSLVCKIKRFCKNLRKYYYQKILRRHYFRYGKCAMCGCCCENIYIRHNNKLVKTESEFEEIRKTDSYDFYQHIDVIGKDDFGLIFSCNKFDKAKRLCSDHKNRPSICRNYPSEEIFSFGAALKETCGFYFEPVESFEEVFLKVSKNR